MHVVCLEVGCRCLIVVQEAADGMCRSLLGCEFCILEGCVCVCVCLEYMEFILSQFNQIIQFSPFNIVPTKSIELIELVELI